MVTCSDWDTSCVPAPREGGARTADTEHTIDLQQISNHIKPTWERRPTKADPSEGLSTLGRHDTPSRLEGATGGSSGAVGVVEVSRDAPEVVQVLVDAVDLKEVLVDAVEV